MFSLVGMTGQSVHVVLTILTVLFHSADLPVRAVGAEAPGHPVPPGVCVHQTDLLRVPGGQGAHQEGPGAVRAQHRHDRYIKHSSSDGADADVKLMTDCKSLSVSLFRGPWQTNPFPAEVPGSVDPGGQQEPGAAWSGGARGLSHPHTSHLPT